jgi:hypothetical protein
MNKFGFALAGAVSLALAGCSGGNDDALNNVDAYNDSSADLNALATDAANDAEAEALGNQAAQLNEEGNAADELNASDTTEAEENVAGM